MNRAEDLIKIVGQENYEKIRKTKCLLVGTGGIGSELLKDLISMEFGEIHLVDLDTIDLSNLNRQFLFRKRDIKQPKSTTAVKAVQKFANSKLVPYTANIMDTSIFPLHWFNQFDIIFNALDNLAARRYVNKISQFLKLPLLESGTAGFDGYIQPIIPNKTECFDCTKKETPKTFPVCTIRSTPSQPIHCIVWAKNFLFSQLFAFDDNTDEDEDKKEWGTTDEDEIKRIKQETNELQLLKDIIISNKVKDIPQILKKLFINDVEKLLLIDNLWKTRTKPIPLNENEIQISVKDDSNTLNLNTVWTLSDQIQKFIQVTKKLMERMPKENNFIEFDKDDDDTLEFVATAANIRAHIFHIPLKTVFDIKQIAGNIIPAIATTNAIIAGLSSLVSLRVLGLLSYAKINKPTDLNMAFTAKASNLSQNRYISNPQLASPNCKCPVCSKVSRGVVSLTLGTLNSLTLDELINLIKSKYNYDDEISLLDMKDQRLLADFDFDDLLSKTLYDLKLTEGSILLFSDDSDRDDNMIRKPLELYLTIVENSDTDFILPDIEVPLIPIEKEENSEKEEEEEDQIMENIKVDGDNIVILDDEEEASVENIENTSNNLIENENDAILIIESDDEQPESNKRKAENLGESNRIKKVKK